MKHLSDFLGFLSSLVWGLPLVILLIGTGLYCAWISRFIGLRGFLHALRLVSGRFSHPGDADARGQITYFQGLMNAMASTVGMGNISGVAIAISAGGPGAVFWMWVAALIGMNTRFFETTMVMAHRSPDFRGDYQGGAMYVLQRICPKPFRWLAGFFAIAGLIGTLSAFQANQLSALLTEQTGTPGWVTGLALAVLVTLVMAGGLRSLVATTSSLVPLMCLLYAGACLFILGSNAAQVPQVLLMIIERAFTAESAAGGAAGIAIREVLVQGVRRGTFSNEAGLGTAPLAHGNVRTSEPVAEGLVAMLGPFFDTMVVCTMTALVILISTGTDSLNNTSGILLTMNAFESALPRFGIPILNLVIILFVFTTIAGMSNYNRKCWNFIFRGHRLFREPTFIAWFAFTVFAGASFTMKDVINLIDSAYALMAIPNLVAILLTAPTVAAMTRSYFSSYLGNSASRPPHRDS